MIQYIEKTLIDHWDLPAYSDYQGESYSYADVASHIVRLHLLFEEAGIRRGDRIAVCGPNSSRWGIAFMAVVSYGAVVVPILNDFQPEQIHHIVNHSETRLLFAAANIRKVVEPEQMPDLYGILAVEDFSPYTSTTKLQAAIKSAATRFLQTYPNGQLRAEQVKFEPEADGDDLMMINYTSGTTGFSKGVMLPYRAFDSNVEFACGQLNSHIKAGDNILSILPMAHMYGLMLEFIYESLRGCHIFFLIRKPSQQVIAQACKEVRPRVIMAVPLILEKTVRMKVMKKFMASKSSKFINFPIIGWFIKRKVSKELIEAFGGNMYECVIAGAPLNQEVERFLHSIDFPLTVAYGATECAPIITYSDWKSFVPGSCGRAVVNMEVRIDSNDPQTVSGEILARGKSVMLGYYKNPEATAEALDAEGWYHTGDLGLMDRKGNVFIKGRKKNMLLGPNGQNIYPEEIEDKLNSMLMVSESIVVQRNNRLEAIIHPDYDDARDLRLTDENIYNILELDRKDLNEMLPAYEHIQAVNIQREEFEKTAKRSIKRHLYK